MEVGSDIYLAHCPERILPGDVFNEIVQNDRIIGGVNSESNKIALEMYSSFVEGEIYETDDVTAELCKLVENTYRDVNIALSNELSFVADTLNLDIGQVIALANKHPRVNMLNPGIGVGGHCIPLDPWFITEVDPNNTVLIQTARRLNDNIPNLVARKIRRILSGINSPKIIALGLAYKPNTSDTRESPAIQIIDSLITDGYHVDSYDPLVEGKEYISLKEIAKGSDCIIVLVEHDIILKNIRDDYEEIIKVLKSNIILNSQCKSLMESNDDMLN
jgi:UDP-N-acetyl-D-mannosaminuronic acid dehydrogenase